MGSEVSCSWMCYWSKGDYLVLRSFYTSKRFTMTKIFRKMLYNWWDTSAAFPLVKLYQYETTETRKSLIFCYKTSSLIYLLVKVSDSMVKDCWENDLKDEKPCPRRLSTARDLIMVVFGTLTEQTKCRYLIKWIFPITFYQVKSFSKEGFKFATVIGPFLTGLKRGQIG